MKLTTINQFQLMKLTIVNQFHLMKLTIVNQLRLMKLTIVNQRQLKKQVSQLQLKISFSRRQQLKTLIRKKKRKIF